MNKYIVSESTAELMIAENCKRILETKWWQFSKRNKLSKENKEIAKKWAIDYD